MLHPRIHSLLHLEKCQYLFQFYDKYQIFISSFFTRDAIKAAFIPIIGKQTTFFTHKEIFHDISLFIKMSFEQLENIRNVKSKTS